MRTIFEEPLFVNTFRGLNPLRKPITDSLKRTRPNAEIRGLTEFAERAPKATYEAISRILETPGRLAQGAAERTPLRPLAPAIGLTADIFTPGPGELRSGPKAFEGFKDLSTKLLERMKGRTVVSKQYISDLTNMPDVKQSERELLRRNLESFQEQVPVKEFADRVKTELLPLKSVGTDKNAGYLSGRAPKYENISLPDELRGPVANYQERIYESPIKTSAGEVHFSGGGADSSVPNYFAHTRIEDLPRNPKMYPSGRTAIYDTDKPGDTRRVIELQSDLFQKGRLENEFGSPTLRILAEGGEAKLRTELENIGYKGKELERLVKRALSEFNPKRAQELSKLEPYRNTWHERIIREEVKQAAKDGKTKLQFPTGETAMKIEGLGETSMWRSIDKYEVAPGNVGSQMGDILKAEDLKVGKEILQGDDIHYAGNKWIITDVLGDGKFKAISKGNLEAFMGDDLTQSQALKALDPADVETFDISGKVDTSNPIYRFYEKEVGKYLTNKYGAQRVTDPQGVEWYEINIKPEIRRLPIEAFGVAPFVFSQEKRDNSREIFPEPLFIKR